jgi:hypothetical protein
MYNAQLLAFEITFELPYDSPRSKHSSKKLTMTFYIVMGSRIKRTCVFSKQDLTLQIRNQLYPLSLQTLHSTPPNPFNHRSKE